MKNRTAGRHNSREGNCRFERQGCLIGGDGEKQTEHFIDTKMKLFVANHVYGNVFDLISMHGIHAGMRID